MSISLNRYDAGDTDYVGNFNSDNAKIEAAINNLEANVGIVQQGGGAMDDVWTDSGLIGYSSFQFALVSDTDLLFTSGSVWHLGVTTRGRQTATQQVTFIGFASGNVYINADTAGGLTASTDKQGVPLYAVCWGGTEFGPTSTARLVPILFDGEDYARMLSGATFGSHTRVADRLSSIEGAMDLDAMFAQVAVSIDTPITWDYLAGRVRDDNVVISVAASSLTLSDAATHYVEIDPTTGLISYTSEGGFTTTQIALRVISTAGGALISSADFRTWAFAGTGGGGNANSGTTDDVWKLNRAQTGAASDAILAFERDTDPTVGIRYENTISQWEFTNDGTSWVPLGSLKGLNLGVGTQTRFVPVVSQPLVLNLAAQDPTGAPPYVVLGLETWVSTTTQAVLLRGYMIDSHADEMNVTSTIETVFFRDSAETTNTAGAAIFACLQSQVIATELIVPVSEQAIVYSINASSDGSADIAVALVGYWDQVAGVGTQLVSARAISGSTQTLCAIVSTTDFLLSYDEFSAVMLRGLVHKLQTSGTIGAGSLYDIEIYGDSAFTATNLLFQALNIDASATYTTRLPWQYEDLESATEVYLRISHQALSAGLFTFDWSAERFA